MKYTTKWNKSFLSGMKGTGKWTVQQAAELSVAAPTIAASLDCRYLSGLKKEREVAAEVLREAGLKEEVGAVRSGIDKKRLIDDVRQALYASKICSYELVESKESLPQSAKEFRKSFFPRKDLKKLLDLPVQRRRAPLLLNYILTYKSVLPDTPKKKSKSSHFATTPPATSSSRPDQGSTSDLAEQPSTSAPYVIPPSQCKCQRRTAIAAEMGCKKVVADNLLADIPDVGTAQPAQSQPQPKPKPKRLKKVEPKTTVTQIDTEDTLLISKIAEAEKSASAVEKRPAEAAPSESTRSKRPRSKSATTSGSLKSNAPWASPITIEDKSVRASDSVDDIEAIQHGHSFAMQAFNIKKELVHKTKEAVNLSKSLNKVEGKMKALTNRAEATKKAQDEAEEKADVAEAIAKVLAAEKKEAEAKAKMVEAQKELQEGLATKEDEIKAADEKAYAEGAADVKEDYKRQVRQTCNKGYTLGWMAALKALAIPEDSPLRNANSFVLPFPPTPSQSKDDSESEKEALDEEGEVSKDASSHKTNSEVLIAEKSLDQTLQEIDVELEAENVADKSSQLSFGAEEQSIADAE
ncbi:uncharacterized protein LOC114272318 [Camellia sinensis]|uniref:uncharacterized protein LOC114272318 n=1 Tax=Camellia sinensis TaxID=4442 RepID=UPI001036ED1D|nr:uncharacterized protein LOC114272318 [Camellia sinensis]